MPAPKEFVCNTLRFAQQHEHVLVKTLGMERPRPYKVELGAASKAWTDFSKLSEPRPGSCCLRAARIFLTAVDSWNMHVSTKRREESS